MKTTTAIVLTTLVALTVQHCAVAGVIYMDADTSVSKNPYGLARRPKQQAGGTVCPEKDAKTQSACDDSNECEWSNGHCGCRYAVSVRRCLNGKLTVLYYPKTTNFTLASTERANNKTWTDSRTSELNLWANCVKLSNSYNMVPVSNTYLESGETSTNRYYYKTLDCTGIDDYEKPVTRVYNDSACVNLIKTASGSKTDNMEYLPPVKGKYYCPWKDSIDPKAMCSTNAACGTLSTTLTPGCETEAGCTSSPLSTSLVFEDSGTQTCTWENSKCGCPSGAYRQIICYNNTQFEVVWNNAEGCLNGTSAGLSNVITTTKVTEEKLTECKDTGSDYNGTNYKSRRPGFCQGRPDFTPPLTVLYTSSGCTGTASNNPGYERDLKDTGKCICASSGGPTCVSQTFACDGNGGLITKMYAPLEKFSTSSRCSGTPQSTSTTNTKVANDWGAFTLDTCGMHSEGDYSIQFTCIGVPAGNSPISYAKAGACPPGGINANNKEFTNSNSNSSSLYCACLSPTSPSPGSSPSPSPSNVESLLGTSGSMAASASTMAAGAMMLFTGYLNVVV